MSKELMEIGGFITEGAEIVNHDNSLSGNGTVDSPLGVVPGYNETVLWSSEISPTLGQTITASEDFTNFDRIGLYFQGYKKIEYVIPYSTTGNWNLIKGAGVSNSWMQMCSIKQQSSNTLALTAGKNINFGAFTSTSTTLTATTGLGDGFNLIKIVGINRISGNE